MRDENDKTFSMVCEILTSGIKSILGFRSWGTSQESKKTFFSLSQYFTYRGKDFIVLIRNMTFLFKFGRIIRDFSGPSAYSSQNS